MLTLSHWSFPIRAYFTMWICMYCASPSYISLSRFREIHLILSGKFAIFAQILTWVEKFMENREKCAESSALVFRILRLHFGAEIAILKLWNSIKIHLIEIKCWKYDFRNQRRILHRMMCESDFFEFCRKMMSNDQSENRSRLQLRIVSDLAIRR